MLSVARMPFLSMLNGSDVRVKERIEAEKSYVSTGCKPKEP